MKRLDTPVQACPVSTRPPQRRGRPGPRLAFAALLVSLLTAAALLAAPPAARAQAAADALIGCFATTPGGPNIRIDRQGRQYGFTFGRGERYILVPATGDDERMVAEELGLNRFPGVSIIAGLSDEDGWTIFVVLSSTLSWQGQRTHLAVFDYDFGLEPLFRVNCP